VQGSGRLVGTICSVGPYLATFLASLVLLGATVVPPIVGKLTHAPIAHRTSPVAHHRTAP
jgi:hypothetical protein